MGERFKHVDWNLMNRVTDGLLVVAKELLLPTDYESCAAPCESPIEHAFLLAFCGFCDLLHIDYMRSWVHPTMRPQGYILITAQAQVDGFRVDFLIEDDDQSVVVECDGHDFHERTKEQAERDRSRDRRFQELGHAVFRFTGREIYRDAVRCADQVFSFLDGKEKRP